MYVLSLVLLHTTHNSQVATEKHRRLLAPSYLFRNLRFCPLVSSFTVLWLNFYHTLAKLSMFVHTQVCGGGPPCYRQQQPSNDKPSLDPSQRHCCCCCAQSMCSPRFHPLAQLSYIKQLLLDLYVFQQLSAEQWQ